MKPTWTWVSRGWLDGWCAGGWTYLAVCAYADDFEIGLGVTVLFIAVDITLSTENRSMEISIDLL